MQKTSITYRQALTSELDATIHIERIGQHPANIDDRVMVCLTIALPTVNSHLHPDIHFGDRVKVLGDRLYMDWGMPDNGPTRSHSLNFDATTWADAFQQAHNHAMTEMNILIDALNRRSTALMEAESGPPQGDPYVRAIDVDDEEDL